MYLVIILVLSHVIVSCLAGETMSPIELLIAQQHKELSKTIPIPFRPGDGLMHRKEYKEKYGERGERLIALLGGGATPLSVFDAALLQDEDNSGTEIPDAYDDDFTTKRTTTTTTAPWRLFGRRKYVDIDRKTSKSSPKKNTDNGLYQTHVLTQDDVAYKRLHGALWKHNTRGNTAKATTRSKINPSLPKYATTSLMYRYTTETPLRTSTSTYAYAAFAEPSIMIKSYSY